MQFMITVRRNAAKSEAPPVEMREAEFEKIRDLYMEGTLQQIWLSEDFAIAYIVAEAPSVQDVTERFNALPLLKEGFVEPLTTIIPLKPYPGFAARAAAA